RSIRVTAAQAGEPPRTLLRNQSLQPEPHERRLLGPAGQLGRTLDQLIVKIDRGPHASTLPSFDAEADAQRALVLRSVPRRAGPLSLETATRCGWGTCLRPPQPRTKKTTMNGRDDHATERDHRGSEPT